MSTAIEGKAILVTGANRGIGQALLAEALRRGAARVYAGTRRPYTHPDPRVTVLQMDITRALDIPKASPQSVARGIFVAVEKGEEDIFPDPLSAALADAWHAGPDKALERQNATLLRPQPVAS